jgi:hypothetical protein
MNREVGKVAWSSSSIGSNNKGDEKMKKIPFLSMEGYGKSWKVRILSEEPLRYWCHFTADKNGSTVKLNCTLDASCPVRVEKTKTVCAGNQAEARYYLKVLDRADNKVKVIDVGRQIVSAIGNLIDNADWGHCKGYDVTIKKGEKGAMPLYTVEPSPHKALTDEEVSLAYCSDNPEHPDFIDLESRIQPLDSDTANKILRGSNFTPPTSSSSSSSTRSSTPTPLAKSVPKVTKSKDDDDFEVDWDEA